MVCSATVIERYCDCTGGETYGSGCRCVKDNQPYSCTCDTPGYGWLEEGGVGITEPGTYTFASNVRNGIRVSVQSSGVTIDGTGITLGVIAGRDDLDLKNMNIHVDYYPYGSAITGCRNIENSRIVVRSGTTSWVYGIQTLYGVMENTTITVENTGTGSASGVSSVSDGGAISGGAFAVTSQEGGATGVTSLSGTISGGTFTVTSQNREAYGVRIVSGNGIAISGGTFYIFGNISGGISNFVTYYGEPLMTGGTFWSVGQERAYGILQNTYSADFEKSLMNGTIYAWSPDGGTTTAIGDRVLPNATYFPEYTFTYDGTEYTRKATEYKINDAILVEIGNAPSTALICPDGIEEYEGQECASVTDSYSWSGSTVTVKKPNEYTFAKNADFPSEIIVEVTVSKVKLDGDGVVLHRIVGKEDLDLKNITITATNPDGDFAITECNNIEKSSIIVTSRELVSGIGTLRGKLKDTEITITSTDTSIVGITGIGVIRDQGEIVNGKITVNGLSASGILTIQDDGKVSNGEFNINGSYAVGIVELKDRASISDGTFTIKSEESEGEKSVAHGILTLKDQTSINGGTFIVSGNTTHGIEEIADSATITNIHMWSIGTEQATGISGISSEVDLEKYVKGGTISVWGPTKKRTVALEKMLPLNPPWVVEKSSQFSFISPLDQKEYTKSATISIKPNGPIFRELYTNIPVVFVHGFWSGPETFEKLNKALKDESIDTWDTFDYNTFFDPRDNAVHLQRYIAEKRDETGYSGPIDIIAHSMGGVVSRWYMEEVEPKNAKNVRQWIGIAPATGGVAYVDMAEAADIFDVLFWSNQIRCLINLFLRTIGSDFQLGDLGPNQLSPSSKTIETLRGNVPHVNTYEGEKTKYRVIMGYTPGIYKFDFTWGNRSESLYNLLKVIGLTDWDLPLVTKQADNKFDAAGISGLGVNSFTFLGDGVIANRQSWLGHEQFDALAFPFPDDPRRFNHVRIHKDQVTIDKVIAYYIDPSLPSQNKVPKELVGNAPILEVLDATSFAFNAADKVGGIAQPWADETWLKKLGRLTKEKAKKLSRAKTMVVIKVAEELGFSWCTPSSVRSAVSLLSSDCMDEGGSFLSTESFYDSIRIVVTYESGNMVELTPDNAPCIDVENSFVCAFHPEEEGDYLIELFPVGRETFGFDGEVNVTEFVVNDMLDIYDILPSYGKPDEVLSNAILFGHSFDEGMTVMLSRAGSPDIHAMNVVYQAPFQATCTIPLTGAAPGLWDLTITNPDGESVTLQNAFEVTGTEPSVRHVIGAYAGDGGSISPAGIIAYLAGSDPMYVITPESGYVIDAIFIDYEEIAQKTSPYMFEELDADHTIHVLFKRDSALVVSGISPSTGTNTESLPVTISGEDFQEGVEVYLTRIGSSVKATDVMRLSSTQLTCTLPLTGVLPRVWDVTVRNLNGDFATLPGAFEVTGGEPITCDPACGDGYICQNGNCVPVTPICDPVCTDGYTCVNGNCVPITPICDPACGDGFTCVNGNCVPVTPDCDEDPTTTYKITAKNGEGDQYGGIAVPTGEWQVNACAEFVISFDSRPGHVLEHISVNEELLPPEPYISLRADQDYEIVAVGALRENQIFVDFTAEICTDDSCVVSVPCTETPCRGTVPLKVIFIAEDNGVPDVWDWDLGNGERKEGKRVETQYTMPGLYTVSLTGKQGELSGTVTKIGYIYVEPIKK